MLIANVIAFKDMSSGTAGAGPYKCPSDYLILNYIRMCGSKLNNDLYSQNSPTNDIAIIGTRVQAPKRLMCAFHCAIAKSRD